MLRNAVKMLINNLGLKMLALLFAITMWMAVVNLEDPTVSKPFTIAVTIENEDYIASMNKYYEIEGENANVKFTVLGKRSIIEELSGSDFKAIADMSQLIQGEDENVVPIEIIALRHSSQLTISKRTRQLKVLLEDLMSQSFVILPSAQGKPAEGYALGTMEVSPNRLKVSGPKDVVSQIESVRAAIDISDMSTDITDSAALILLDSDGNTVDTTRLTLNRDIVNIKVNIVSEKTVPIRASYSGRPKEGYEVISIKTTPSEVMIKGESDILNSISAITIPESVISVDGADELFEQRVDLNQYLPDGVVLSNSRQANVRVKVDVEQLERRSFTVPVDNIGVDGLPEGYRLEFNSRNVVMEIYGLADDLDELTADTLRPVLDVSGLMAGRHVGKLDLAIDNKYVVGDATVSFTIFSGNSEGADPGDDGSGDDDGTGSTEPGGGTAADNEGTQPDDGEEDQENGRDNDDGNGSAKGNHRNDNQDLEEE